MYVRISSSPKPYQNIRPDLTANVFSGVTSGDCIDHRHHVFFYQVTRVVSVAGTCEETHGI